MQEDLDRKPSPTAFPHWLALDSADATHQSTDTEIMGWNEVHEPLAPLPPWGEERMEGSGLQGWSPKRTKNIWCWTRQGARDCSDLTSCTATSVPVATPEPLRQHQLRHWGCITKGKEHIQEPSFHLNPTQEPHPHGDTLDCPAQRTEGGAAQDSCICCMTGQEDRKPGPDTAVQTWCTSWSI